MQVSVESHSCTFPPCMLTIRIIAVSVQPYVLCLPGNCLLPATAYHCLLDCLRSTTTQSTLNPAPVTRLATEIVPHLGLAALLHRHTRPGSAMRRRSGQIPIHDCNASHIGRPKQMAAGSRASQSGRSIGSAGVEKVEDRAATHPDFLCFYFYLPASSPPGDIPLPQASRPSARRTLCGPG